MQRNRYGKFVIGNKGGPGRPRKERVESLELKAFAIEPFDDADGCAWLDYIRCGRWAAVDCGGVFEVLSKCAWQTRYIQFRVKILGNGRKVLERIGERIADDEALMNLPCEVEENAHDDDSE